LRREELRHGGEELETKNKKRSGESIKPATMNRDKKEATNDPEEI